MPEDGHDSVSVISQSRQTLSYQPTPDSLPLALRDDRHRSQPDRIEFRAAANRDRTERDMTDYLSFRLRHERPRQPSVCPQGIGQGGFAGYAESCRNHSSDLIVIGHGLDSNRRHTASRTTQSIGT